MEKRRGRTPPPADDPTPPPVRFKEIWNAIDMHEEHHTMRQAREVHRLKRAIKEGRAKRGKPGETVHSPSPPSSPEAKRPRVETAEGAFSISLPPRPDDLELLLVRFSSGDLLSAECAKEIVSLATRLLKSAQTLTRISVPKDGRLTVCGDIHGQLPDLITIFKQNGLPSPTNAYLFNGDFVDRGPHGVECLLTLLAFKLLYPTGLYLNRGNHEAKHMNCKYHFQDEVLAKYGKKMYHHIQTLFNHLPLCSLIEHKILVLHGGLFAQDGVLLSHIEALDRVRQPPEESQSKEDELFTDILWSDPREIQGREASDRGAGVHFGADVTHRFLKENNLDLIIRSHEMMDEGYKYSHEGKLLTVFSASDYCGSNENEGAFVIIDPQRNLSFVQYKASELENLPKTKFDPKKVEEETLGKIRERIFERSSALTAFWHKVDTDNDAIITLEQFAQGLREVTHLNIDWIGLYKAGYLGTPIRRAIEYPSFLNRYRIQVPDEVFQRYAPLVEQLCTKMYDSLHSIRGSFKAYDIDRVGFITAEKFTQVIKDMHLGLTDHALAALVRSVDSNNDGRIDLREYLNRFEVVYRRVGKQKHEEQKWFRETISQFSSVVKDGKKSLHEVFHGLDKEEKKQISYKQFSKGVKELGIQLSKDDRYRLAEQLDTDKNGHIDYDEFAAGFKLVDPALNTWRDAVVNQICATLFTYKHHLKDLFRSFDKDDSGTIDYEEFNELFSTVEGLKPHIAGLSELQRAELFRMFDDDGNGEIDYEEFTRFLESFEIVEIDS